LSVLLFPTASAVRSQIMGIETTGEKQSDLDHVC
jgi:hypothetical protein